MTDAYFDSAIIVKLYVREANSPEAIRLVAACSPPCWLTQWQSLEVRNAIRLKAFRKEITVEEMNQSAAAFEHDVSIGRWQRPVYANADVDKTAEEFSAGHSAQLGCRTLDIMHVAAAVVLGAKRFVTFDGRQGTLARHVGLMVVP